MAGTGWIPLVAVIEEFLDSDLLEELLGSEPVSSFVGLPALAVGGVILLLYFVVVDPYLRSGDDETAADETTDTETAAGEIADAETAAGEAADDDTAALDPGWVGTAVQQITPVTGAVRVESGGSETTQVVKSREGTAEAGTEVVVVDHDSDGVPIVLPVRTGSTDQGTSRDVRPGTTAGPTAGSGGRGSTSSAAGGGTHGTDATAATQTPGVADEGDGSASTYEVSMHDGSRFAISASPVGNRAGSRAADGSGEIAETLDSLRRAIAEQDLSVSAAAVLEYADEIAREYGVLIHDVQELEPIRGSDPPLLRPVRSLD